MKLKKITALFLSFCLLLTLFAGFPAHKAEAGNEQIVTIGSAVVPVYTDASSTSTQSAAAAPNNTFLLLDTKLGTDGAVWYRICFSSSISGWVSSSSGAVSEAAVPTSPDPYTQYLDRVVRVTENFVLRDRPGTGNKEVARVSVNDRMVVLNHGTDSAGVTWYEVRFGSVQGWIRRTAVEMTNICSAPAPLDCSREVPVIFLSPSRQPNNPYAAGKTNECEQMTRVAVELKKILEADYLCKVILSDYETPIGKSGRPTKAVQQGADIYLAIHSNAGGSAGTGYGPQAYYYPGSAQNKLMAENLIDSLDAVLPFPNTNKRAINGMQYLGGVGYGEVRDPGGFGMLSILLEVEFHDHADSALWIINNTRVLAQAIAEGLHKTFSFKPAPPRPVTTPTDITSPTDTTTTTTATTTTTTTSTTTSTTTTTTTTIPTTTTTAAPPAPVPKVVRMGAGDRIGTAIEISKTGWDKADTVIIASGSNYADALAGVPLSHAADAPLLLTTAANGAERELIAEVQRLGARKAYILGGPAAVSSGTESDLTAAGVSCVRLFGDDRYETGVEVAKELAALTGKPFDTVYFASALNFPDALAISPVAAVGGNPVLYIHPTNGLSTAVADYVKATGCSRAVLLGGDAAVSEYSAESISGAGMSVERISGDDRYATALAIAGRFSDVFEGTGAAVATGKNFPDALAGGAHAAKLGVPVLLVGSAVDSALLSFASGLPTGDVYVYGGTSAVSQDIADAVAKAMN